MPFITIKSLPFEEPLDYHGILKELCTDFARDTGIDLQHVSSTWEFFDAGRYIVGGECREFQPKSTHPMLIEILAPDFNTYEVIEKMILSVADSLAKRANIPHENIFINCSLARSGLVYDGGKIITWSNLL